MITLAKPVYRQAELSSYAHYKADTAAYHVVDQFKRGISTVKNYALLGK